MALTRVQATSGTNTTFASVVTTTAFAGSTVAGNLLIAVMEADATGLNGCTVTDNKVGNTWNRVLSNNIAATFDFEIWYCVLTQGGAGHTVTCTDNGGGVDSILIVEEWSGNATAPNDVSTSAVDSGGASSAQNSTATSTTSQANEVVIGGTCVAGPPASLTLGAGYTNLTSVATAFTRLGFESKIVSATGTQTATFTSATAGSWICGVATFKELVAAQGSASTSKGTLAFMGAG